MLCMPACSTIVSSFGWACVCAAAPTHHSHAHNASTRLMD
jgi:hypothetical protein